MGKINSNSLLKYVDLQDKTSNTQTETTETTAKQTKENKTIRVYKPEWKTTYNWLERSDSEDKWMCNICHSYACHLPGARSNNWMNFHKPSGGQYKLDLLKQHQNSKLHKECIAYKINLECGAQGKIDTMFHNSNKRKLIETEQQEEELLRVSKTLDPRNWHVYMTLCALFIAEEEMAFSKMNKLCGFVQNVIQLYSETLGESLESTFDNYSVYGSGTNKEKCKSIINTISEMTLENTVKEIKNVSHVSIVYININININWGKHK